MKQQQRANNESGQALIALLIFMMMAFTLTAAAAAITIVNTQTNTAYVSGDTALEVAESGAENAMQQLLRNPSYTGETVTIGSGTATITVSGTTTKTIISVGAVNNVRRTVTVVASYSGTVLSETSWNETP
jgi:hypothetical protein